MAIGIIATLKVQDGKADEFIGVFRELQAKVIANESGCNFYAAHQDAQDPNTFVILEQYETQEDLAAHGKTEYFVGAQPAIGACLAGSPDIRLLNAI